MDRGVVAAVAAGGGIGTIIRYSLTEAFAPSTPPHFDWLTLTINVSGAFCLAVVYTLLTSIWRNTVYVRPFLAVGVIGGYTTWSHFIIESNQLIDAGQAVLAVVCVVSSMVLGLLAATAGVALAEACVRTRGGSAG
jgi:CrcB protein